MEAQEKFPYKAGDIVRFPDTESEYVDVGVGEVKVAEQLIYTIMQVVKRGRGYMLRFMYKDDYSEVFSRKGIDRKGRLKTVSLQEYREYFGGYSQLELIGDIKTWEDDNNG